MGKNLIEKYIENEIDLKKNIKEIKEIEEKGNFKMKNRYKISLFFILVCSIFIYTWIIGIINKPLLFLLSIIIGLTIIKIAIIIKENKNILFNNQFKAITEEIQKQELLREELIKDIIKSKESLMELLSRKKTNPEIGSLVTEISKITGEILTEEFKYYNTEYYAFNKLPSLEKEKSNSINIY